MLVNVLIPVYTSTLSRLEIASLKQCLKILENYPITIVTNQDVDLSVYKQQYLDAGKAFAVEYFDTSYFESVFSYSKLLLSKDFYSRFSAFQYVFIYQLDGFVFRDELKKWCIRDYDYIGAPWFKRYGKNYNGNKLWKVGNGGVSLRKVSTFIETFDKTFPISGIWYYLKSLRVKKMASMLPSTIKMIFVLIFTKKTVEHILNAFTDERVNEDCFWCEALQYSSIKLDIPEVLTGARFCLEKKPSYVYTLIGRELPFCCHAFEKFEYDEFWKTIIDKELTSNELN